MILNLLQFDILCFRVHDFGVLWSQVVKALVAADESKSMINSVDEDGWAPLHSAASSGNIEIVEMLLSKGKGVKLNFLIFAYGL
jgi:ankyrin repeat protein